MNTLRICTTAVLVMGLLTTGTVLARQLDDEPGYVDLEWIDIPEDADEIQDIDLSTVLLSIARDAEEAEDDALLEALSMVRSIRVKAWSVESRTNDNETSEAVEKITAELRKNGWKRLIYVKDHDETLAVSTRYENEDLVGLMLVTYEPGDNVAFVNVVGDLDLGALFKLASRIDQENLDEMLEELEDIEGVEVNRRSH